MAVFPSYCCTANMNPDIKRLFEQKLAAIAREQDGEFAGPLHGSKSPWAMAASSDPATCSGICSPPRT